jgi:membrane complex biogenesis BtpA family protein
MSRRLPAFGVSRPVIAMIHVGALPGTPASAQSLRRIEAAALREARLYRDAGVDGLMLENMHDTPYLRGGVGPEIVAALSIVARAVKDATQLPCGIQILAAANLEAIAVAHAAELDFIRAEGFAFAHVADEGIIQSSAAELLRYRRRIGAERVQVWADVKKKHSAHAITADVGIGETAHAVEFMRGDAVIVTGTVTGNAPQLADVRAIKAATALPVLLGSGVTAENVASFLAEADGCIVGSEFKAGGHWAGAVDARRVRRFLRAAAVARRDVPARGKRNSA